MRLTVVHKRIGSIYQTFPIMILLKQASFKNKNQARRNLGLEDFRNDSQVSTLAVLESLDPCDLYPRVAGIRIFQFDFGWNGLEICILKKPSL